MQSPGSVYFVRTARMLEHPAKFADRRMKTAEMVLFSELPEITWLASPEVIKFPPLLGTGQILAVKEQANAMQLDVEVNANPAVLVIPGGYNNQWYALVDGFESTVLCADGISRALIIPPGQHTILLSFVPVSFQAGAAVAAFTTLFLIFIFTTGLGVRGKG